MRQETIDQLNRTLDHLKELGETNSDEEYLDPGDALDALTMAYDAIEAVLMPSKSVEPAKHEQPGTLRIVICCDIDADSVTDAYRKLFRMLWQVQRDNELEWFDWESSDEWYFEDGERVPQNIVDAARSTVFNETQIKKYNIHVRLADQIEAHSEEEAFDRMVAKLDGRDGFEIMGHDIIEETP